MRSVTVAANRKIEVQLVLKDAASAEFSKFDAAAKKTSEDVKKLDGALKNVAATTKRAGNEATQSAEKANRAARKEIQSVSERIRLLNAEIRGGQVAMQVEQARIRVRRQGQTLAAAQLQKINQLLQKERDLKKTLDEQVASRRKQVASTTAATTKAGAGRSIGGAILGGTGRTIAGLAAGIGAVYAIRGAFNTLVDFETGLVGVGKTSGLAGKELEAFGDDVIALSQKIPVTSVKLLEIAEAAGQIGVKGSDNILKFTDTIAKLESATDLAGAEAAKTLARLINVTGENQGSVDRLGSALVALGNSTAASEREIALMGMSVAQNTAVFKISSATAAGLGSALAAMGVESELAGSAMGRTMRAMDMAIRGNSAALKTLSNVTGMTGESFSKAFRQDAAGAMQVFLRGLDGVIQSGGDAAAVLRELGLQDIRILKVLPLMAQRHEIVSESVRLSNEAYRENKALNEEAARAYETLGSKVTLFGNALAAAVLGQRDSTSAMSKFVETLTDTVRLLAGTTTEADKVSDASRNIAKALDAMTYAAGAFIAVRMTAYIVSVVNTMWTLIAAIRAGTVATTAFNTVMRINPIIAIASVVATAAAAFRWFGSDVAEATAEVKKHDDALQDLAGSARIMEAAYAKLGRAKLTGNLERETQALDAVKSNLEKQLDELPLLFEKKAKAGKKFTLGDLIQIDPKLAESDLVKNAKIVNLFKLREGGQDWADRWKKTTVSLSDAQSALSQSLQRTNTSIDESTAKLKEQRNAQDAARTADKLREEQQENLRRVQESAKKSVTNYVTSLKDEIEILRVLNSQGEVDAAIREQTLKLDRAQIAYTDEQIKDLRQLLELRKALEDQAQKAADAAKHETRVEHRREDRDAGQPRGFGEGFAAFAGYDVAEKKWRETAFIMADVGNQAASAMFNAFQVQFFDPMTGAFRDLGDIARDFFSSFLQSLAQIASQQAAIAAIKGLSRALGMAGSGGGPTDYTGGDVFAKGGVFDSGGEVTRFASGGIVRSPTVFPFARGTGIMGESGPEAIMPLRRGPGGRLGVEGGGGGGGTTNNISVNLSLTINNPKDVTGVREEMGRQREMFKQELLRALADGQVRTSVKGAAR